MTERRFPTVRAAAEALGPLLDRPAASEDVGITDGVRLRVDSLTLPGGRFTNRYRLSWRPPLGGLRLLPARTAASAYAASHPALWAVSTGGFFFLADDCARRPRCLSLNLAVEDGVVHSLPSADQEALIRTGGGGLTVSVVAARGGLRIDGVPLRWAGVRSPHPAACRVSSNADVVISHVSDPDTGRRRHLLPGSRFCAPAPDGSVNLGLSRLAGRRFRAVAAGTAPLDTFCFDLVLCAPRGAEGSRVDIDDIDGLSPEGLSAISVGPSLHFGDLGRHPLCRERSLGSTPLLLHKPSSRLVFYTTPDGGEHLCLLDGRPGSVICPGATVQEALALVHRDAEVVCGCFLDSGHTPRISVRTAEGWRNLGNRHYLRWPTEADPTYLWTPEAGRPVSSLITIG